MFAQPYYPNVWFRPPLNPAVSGPVVRDLPLRPLEDIGQWVQCLLPPPEPSAGPDFDFDFFIGQPFHTRFDHPANSIVIHALIGLGVNGFAVQSVDYLASRAEWINRNNIGHFAPPDMQVYNLMPGEAAKCLDRLSENYIQ